MPLAGTGMLMVWTDIPPALETDFNAWYNREHVEERVRIPGFLSGRRHRVAGAPGPGIRTYFATYETESVAVLTTPAYFTALTEMTPWSRRIMPRFVDMHRACATVLRSSGRGNGTEVWVARIAAPGTPRDAVTAWYDDALAPLAAAEPEIVGAHLLEADAAITAAKAAGAVEGSAAAGEWIVLIQATAGEAAGAAWDRAVAARPLMAGAALTAAPYRVTYTLLRSELG